MDERNDNDLFWDEMTRLSMALTMSELTIEKSAAYWDALCDLPFDDVAFACQHAARHFQPRPSEPFPVPSTLRQYAALARDKRIEQAMAQARAEEARQLAQHTEPTLHEGLTAIRSIARLLEEKMAMDKAQPAPLDEAERERLIALGMLNPPDPSRWLPLTEDFSKEERLIPHRDTGEKN